MAACDVSQAAVDCRSAEGWQFAVDRRYTVLEEMHILSTFYDRFEDRRPNTSRFISSVGGGAVGALDGVLQPPPCAVDLR